MAKLVRLNNQLEIKHFRIRDGVLQYYDGIEWISLGNVIGPKGDKGDSITGPQGERGPIGEKGDTGRSITGKPGRDGQDGRDGSPGRDGADGASPVHQWDGTRIRFSLPDGSFGSWVDLLGKRGEKGPKGAKGDKGPEGKSGEPGRNAPIPTVEIDQEKYRFRFIIGDKKTKWITMPEGKSGQDGKTIIQQGGGASGASNYVDFKAITADHTIKRTFESGFLIDASSNAVTMTLPNAQSTKKRVYWFKRTDNCKYAVKIETVGGQTVDGKSCVYVQEYENLRIFSDGANWYVI